MAIDAKTQRLPEIAVNQVLNSPLRSCSAPFSNLVHAVRFSFSVMQIVTHVRVGRD